MKCAMKVESKLISDLRPPTSDLRPPTSDLCFIRAQFVGVLNSWEPYQQPRYAREFKPAANWQKSEHPGPFPAEGIRRTDG
jgi:hypothetical protein